ncbi:MAG: hypothetical protein B7Y39_06820 [Bdellovibrio sp. 28-41-41]|nr:MAG: hypothetical protein B7Y39_06820 [Bdellovibrio sp. 28-41-41]
MINVIENAIKYSPTNSHIEVKTFESADFVMIQITDSGIGILADELKKVGQKFFRSQSVPESIKGTGFGLFLVKYFGELQLTYAGL